MRVPINILLLAVLALASISSYAWPSPETAINEFLKFEVSGGRTTSYPFAKYLAVDGQYEEPGWDIVEVVDRYEITKITCGPGQKCEATVKFTLTPTKNIKNEQLVKHPNGGSLVLVYRVIKKNNEWLLSTANDHPKISFTTLKKLFP